MSRKYPNSDDSGLDAADQPDAAHDAMTQRVETALRADASVADIRALIRDLQTHRHETEQRWIAIKPGSPERTRVETFGDLAALQRISRETERLRLMVDSADRQMQALAQARDAAESREASRDLPAMIARLDEQQAQMESNQTEHARLAAAIRKSFSEIGRARVLAKRAGLPAAAGTTSHINRLTEQCARSLTAGRAAQEGLRHQQAAAIELGLAEPHDHLRVA